MRTTTMIAVTADAIADRIGDRLTDEWRADIIPGDHGADGDAVVVGVFPAYHENVREAAEYDAITYRVEVSAPYYESRTMVLRAERADTLMPEGTCVSAPEERADDIVMTFADAVAAIILATCD